MLNTPVDKKIQSNPIKISPYFDRFGTSVGVIPPVVDFIITEIGDNPIISETGDNLIAE